MNLIKKNILISGITGFIGKNLLSSELFTEFNLYCFVRNVNQKHELLKIRNDIIFLDYEILNKPINLNYKIEACIHLAAYGVNPNEEDLTKIVESNILLTLKLYSFSKSQGCDIFLNIGSVFEYGEKYSNVLITEDLLPFPDSLYGTSKFSSHLFLKTINKKINLKFITIRPFGLFGPFESSNRLFPQVLISGYNKKPLLLTSGEQIRNIVYVQDFIKFLYLILNNHQFIKEEIINFTNSSPISIKQFVNFIIKTLNFDNTLFQFGKIPYRKNESMSYIGSNYLMLNYFPNFQFNDLTSSIILSSKKYK